VNGYVDAFLVVNAFLFVAVGPGVAAVAGGIAIG
jgi:hypothetical protein